MFDRLTELVSGAWWSYLVIFAVAYLDVIIPLVPSETLVVTAGVIASSGDLYLPLVILCGALGAFLGDNTVYFIGRRWGDSVKRRFFKSKKAAERLAWADRQLDERGGELIVVARFIPGGRTAVCLSAGGLEMPWRRFATFDAIAAIVWASYAATARLRRRQAVRGGAVEGPRARAAHRLLDRRRRRARALAHAEAKGSP